MTTKKADLDVMGRVELELSQLPWEEVMKYRQFMLYIRTEARGNGANMKSVLDARRTEIPAKFLAPLEGMIQWHHNGPDLGEQPPDFSLKMMGSEQRVRLSSFKGEKPVALIFGTYT